MGLDMFLHARRFIWDIGGTDRDAGLSKAIQAAMPEMGDMRPTYVIAEAMYWRKANAIHKWFVDNVQDGKDDCGTYPVTRDQLRVLIRECNRALDNRDDAKDILPTTSGFFFGGTDYDEWYWTKLQDTVDRLEKLLNDPKLEEWQFEYHSSW